MSTNAAQVQHPALALVGSLLIALIVQFPLLFLDQIWITGDTYHHYHATAAMAASLKEGNLFPSWVATGNLGLGHPGFLYTYPLFYYTAGILHILGLDLWLAMRVSCLLATTATCLVAFVVLHRHLGLRGALLGAVAAGTMPFMYWSLNYYSGFPWYFSFPFLFAFVLASLLKTTEGIRLVIAFSMAGMALSHILTAFMACLCLPLAVIYRNFEGDFGSALRRTMKWGLSCLLGLGVAMFYVYPALTTQHLVRFDSFYQEKILDWHNSFALPVVTSIVYGVYWKLPQWYIPGVLLLLLVATGVVLYKSLPERDVDWKFMAACLIAGLISLLLASDIAYPLYASSGLMQVVQRPLRFVTIASVALAAVSPFALAHAWRLRKNGLAIPLVVAVPFVLAILGSVHQAIDIVANTRSGSVTATIANQRRSHLENSMPTTAGQQWRNYVEIGGFSHDCSAAGLLCQEIINESQKRVWRVSTAQPTTIRLPVFWFPAWQVHLNGQLFPSTIDSSTGLISIHLPPGHHDIELRWHNLPQQRIGQGLSVAALVWLLALLSLRTLRRGGHSSLSKRSD